MIDVETLVTDGAETVRDTRRVDRVGIVGFGSFGRFMGRHLAPRFEVTATDPAMDVDSAEAAAETGVRVAELDDVCAGDVVVLAVPVQNLEEVVDSVSSRLRPGALVVDVCSVKTRPLEIMRRGLPESVEILGTHPMFGPQSGRLGIAGLKIVLCPERLSETRLRCVEQLLGAELELEVLHRDPARHDREMAYIQGLTHWMAKALREIRLPDLELATTAYRHMMKIEEILREDSDALFLTIERENPFATEARRELLTRLGELDEWIRREDTD